MVVLSPPETQSSIAFYGIIGLVGTSIYLLSLAIYRLSFSPLAKFPGPKLAALTQWYEAYYELFSGDGGQFIWHYAKLHEEYGEWALCDYSLFQDLTVLLTGLQRPYHSN